MLGSERPSYFWTFGLKLSGLATDLRQGANVRKVVMAMSSAVDPA
jgi:hypothetical protein